MRHNHTDPNTDPNPVTLDTPMKALNAALKASTAVADQVMRPLLGQLSDYFLGLGLPVPTRLQCSENQQILFIVWDHKPWTYIVHVSTVVPRGTYIYALAHDYKTEKTKGSVPPQPIDKESSLADNLPLIVARLKSLGMKSAG